MNKSVLIMSAMTLLLGSMYVSNAYAASGSDGKSQITSNGDIYFCSKIPAPISFDIRASDSTGQIPVQCDKTSGSVFKLGKTTVRCMAVTSAGDVLRDSFVVTVGYDVVQIPSWFKQTTKLWISSSISDKEYVDALQFLLGNNLIKVPYSKPPKEFSGIDIPIWIKSNSAKWTSDKMTNDEFSIGIQWMIERGVLSTQKERL